MNNDRLSIVNKLCFAVGGLPYQLFTNTLGLFIVPFLLEIAQIRPLQISIVLFTAKGWAAITDPLIGFLASKTNTKIGKLRPWILVSIPFIIISYMMIWYVPDFNKNTKTLWYILFFCLFQFSSSCYHVPYTSLTMYLTHNQYERDSATSYRMFFEIIGVLLAAVIQGVMITIYGTKYSCDSLLNNQTYTNLSSSHHQYNKLGEGYLISAGIMCIIFLICAISTLAGTREIKNVIEDKDNKFFRALKSVFSHKSYNMILLAFLFYSLSIQIIQTNFALYCKYSIDAKNVYQLILIVLLVSSIVTIPFWSKIMVKFGKKTAYSCGLLSFIPCLITLMFIEKNSWFVYFIAAMCGFGISANFLVPWSMLPDVIDEFMINTGTRRESIFYSFYVFFTKLSAAVAISVTSAILDSSGYIDCPNGCCTQPKSVGRTLRLLIVPGPLVMLLIALFFIYKYPINETRRKEIKQKLIEMHELKSESTFEILT